MGIARRSVLAAPVLAALAPALASCSSDDDKSPAAEAKPVTKVTYLTGLGRYGQEAYMEVAIDKGYFREEGIEVEIKPGFGSSPNLKLMAKGQADFCALDSTGAFIERAQPGGVQDWKFVASIHQSTVICISALDGGGITTSPKSLEGHKIGYIENGVNYLLFPTYAKLAGVDNSKIKWVPIGAQQLPQALASGQVDAVTYFVSSKGALEAVANAGEKNPANWKKRTVNLAYDQYMGDLYGNCLAVMDKTVKEKPELVKGFARAMVRGLSDALDHPAEAGTTFAKYVQGYNPKTAESEITLLKPYATRQSAAVGSLDATRMAKMIAILQGTGLITPGITPDQVVSFDLVPKI